METIFRWRYCFVVFLTILQSNGQRVDDFYEHHGDFEFIYHGGEHVLLTVHGNDCFFTSVIDEQVIQLFRMRIKDKILGVVNDLQHNIRHVEHSNMEGVINLYRDRLADIHCRNKSIYILHLDFMECDFEDSSWMSIFCAWTPTLQQSLQWYSHTGDTPSVLTGPHGDHTLANGQGQYLYMEANDGLPGDIAELASPVVNVKGGMCLKFWYFMQGSGMGTLHLTYAQVLLNETFSQPTQETTLWQVKGDQGLGWKTAEVSVRPSSRDEENNVRFYLRAVRGSTHYSDIAIDDITSTFGLCPYTQLGCTFDNRDLCHWRQLYQGDEMDWKIISGQSSHHSRTGPLSGHWGFGSYVFLDGDDGNRSDTGVLQSPVLHLDISVCMTFWYCLAGPTVDGLEVVMLDRTTMREHQLWERTGDHGQNWLEGRITITVPDPETPVQIYFRATRGATEASDVAVDDIIAFVGSCDQLGTS